MPPPSDDARLSESAHNRREATSELGIKRQVFTDVLGLAYADYSDPERQAVLQMHPRTERFNEDIIRAFYDGIKHKSATTFGNVRADVLADKDPGFRPENFCRVIRQSA